jgi:serine/threonine protein kinase
MFSVPAELVEKRRLEPGTRIGAYVLRSVLGAGGTAVVYEAQHVRLGSKVAIKVAQAAAAHAGDVAARLEREARLCANLDDPRIPKVFDVSELQDGTPYLVMEKVSGLTLEQMINDGPLAPKLALAIARELLTALETVHRAGLVHRDVKPSNVHVELEDGDNPRIHLLDFGVSKRISSGVSDPGITRPGSVVGTPLYMAPEQLAADPLDERTDLYAVGVLLYEMLTGHSPFVRDSTAEVVSAILHREHAPLNEAWPEATPELTLLVEHAMEERAAQRFLSAREMRDALDVAVASLDRPRIAEKVDESEAEAAPLLVVRGYSKRTLQRAMWTGLAFGTACALLLPLFGRTGLAEVPQAAAQSIAALPMASAQASLVEAPAAVVAPAPASKAQAQLTVKPRPRPLAKRPVARPVVRERTSHATALLDSSLRDLEGLRGSIQPPVP